MSPYYFVKILENFTKNFELRIYFLTISMREPKFTNFGVENMEDKFLDGMVDASITIMKRLSEGGTLTPDELKFILLTKQMSEKANKQNKSNPLGGLLEGLKPVLPLVGSLLELLEAIKEDKSNEI